MASSFIRTKGEGWGWRPSMYSLEFSGRLPTASLIWFPHARSIPQHPDNSSENLRERAACFPRMLIGRRDVFFFITKSSNYFLQHVQTCKSLFTAAFAHYSISISRSLAALAVLNIGGFYFILEFLFDTRKIQPNLLNGEKQQYQTNEEGRLHKRVGDRS